jgi:hypothetical protein
MPEIISAAHHRNGVSGEPFFVAIVRDVYDDSQGTYMVTHVPDTEDEQAEDYFVPNTKTFVVKTDLLPDVRFGINSWRGDRIPDGLIDQIKKAACENHYTGRLVEA